MAQTHGSLAGLAMVSILGCSLDSSQTGGDVSLPLVFSPGMPGVSLGRSAATHSLNGANESERATPLQTPGGPNLATALPQTPNVFTFAPTPVGTVQQVTWRITNIGDEPSGTLGLNSTNNVDFTANVQSCPSLDFLESCDVTISYAPSTIGAHSSTFSVTGFPLAYTFAGTGREPFGPGAP